jgi:hypothetical protein
LNPERIGEARHQWLTPKILTTWEAEIGRIMVPGQSRQKNFRLHLERKKAGHGGVHLSFQQWWEA